MSPDCVSPQHILIVGGGVSGLITLRNLSLHARCENIELIERRPDVGGVWYLEAQSANSPSPRWQSPAYPGLVGNVLPEFLSFSSHDPFPEPSTSPSQPFPSLDETHAYLKSLAEPFVEKGQIHCNVELVKVVETVHGKWEAMTRNVGTGHEARREWDAVVVCTGWHSSPWWPNTPGLRELEAEGLAIHAKDWASVDFHGLKGKKVLVLGNAASSNDIAAQLADTAPGVGSVFRSIRRPAFPGFPSLADEKIEDVAPVKQYEIEKGRCTAHLSDGRTIEGLDVVIAGTGYRSNPDFVNVRSAVNGQYNEPHQLMQTRVEGEYRIPGLYQHILYAPNPSLAFIGCIMAFTPFTIADLCSTWLALAWTGIVSYPKEVEMRLEWERERLRKTEELRQEFSRGGEVTTNYISYNVLGIGEQEYAATLREQIAKSGAQGEKVASTLPEWNDARTRHREAMYQTKLEALERERDKHLGKSSLFATESS